MTVVDLVDRIVVGVIVTGLLVASFVEVALDGNDDSDTGDEDETRDANDDVGPGGWILRS